MKTLIAFADLKFVTEHWNGGALIEYMSQPVRHPEINLRATLSLR